MGTRCSCPLRVIARKQVLKVLVCPVIIGWTQFSLLPRSTPGRSTFLQLCIIWMDLAVNSDIQSVLCVHGIKTFFFPREIWVAPLVDPRTGYRQAAFFYERDYSSLYCRSQGVPRCTIKPRLLTYEGQDSWLPSNSSPVLSESISFIALWFLVNSCLSVYNSHVFREKTLSLPKFLLFLVSASLNKINQFLYS